MAREADHRIANSLAFLSAMLRFESRRVTSVEAARLALLSAANRIGAASRLHLALARAGRDGGMCLATTLEEIATALSASYDIDINLDINMSHDITVSPEVAGGLCVAVSELATNAVKHAEAKERTTVVVSASEDCNGVLCVMVRDNGRGLPDGFDLETSAGLGMSIVTSTIKRLNGTVKAETGPGARFRIDVPSAMRSSAQDSRVAE